LDSPLPPRSHRFRRSQWFLPKIVPRFTFVNRVHPLVSFAPLQSPPVSHPPLTSRLGAPPMGFAVPLRDINPQRPHSKGSIPHRRSVRDVSHVLDGFLRYWFCGFISPHSHVQGSLFRGCSLAHSRSASSTSRALSSVGRSSLLTVAHQRHVPLPRPQGFNPCESP